MKFKQRGVSFPGIIVLAVIIGFGGIVLAQVVPSMIEYQAITKAANTSKAGSTSAEVKSIFDKAAAIDDIKSISGKDLEITKENGNTVVGFSYTREFHLMGAAFLLLKYNGQSR